MHDSGCTKETEDFPLQKDTLQIGMIDPMQTHQELMSYTNFRLA